MANKRVDFWIETLAFFEDVIEEWGERFPDQIQKVNDYKNVIEEIYNHNKKGLINESLGDSIRRMTDEASKDPEFREKHIDAFGGPNDLMCDDPLYDGEHIF